MSKYFPILPINFQISQFLHIMYVDDHMAFEQSYPFLSKLNNLHFTASIILSGISTMVVESSEG